MIDSEKVTKQFVYCLCKEEEMVDEKMTPSPIVIEGIMHKYALHPGRVKEQDRQILAWLGELPATFNEGYSFLSLCMTKNDEQWTGLHKVCEELMVMALALGRMRYCLPRPFWELMPGGMPYVQIVDPHVKKEEQSIAEK